MADSPPPPLPLSILTPEERLDRLERALWKAKRHNRIMVACLSIVSFLCIGIVTLLVLSLTNGWTPWSTKISVDEVHAHRFVVNPTKTTNKVVLSEDWLELQEGVDKDNASAILSPRFLFMSVGDARRQQNRWVNVAPDIGLSRKGF